MAKPKFSKRRWCPLCGRKQVRWQCGHGCHYLCMECGGMWLSRAELDSENDKRFYGVSYG